MYKKKTVFLRRKSFDAWVGDVLCWNTSTKDWVIVHTQHTYKDSNGNTCDYTKFDSWDSNLVPDAVCIIPACHTDNNKARWIALKDASTSQLQWSTSNTLVDDLPCYASILITSTVTEKTYILNNNKFSDNVNTYKPWATLSTEVGFNSNYITNINSNYYSTSSNIETIMSEQLKDPFEDNILNIMLDTIEGDSYTLNLYGQNNDNYLVLKNSQVFAYKNDSGSLNPLSDLDGQKNTNILVANGIDKFPVAKACVEYSTEYSPAGTWYLPAAGELAYLLSRWYTIQQTLYMLKQTNSNWNVTYLITNDYYWSSTQHAQKTAYRIYTQNNSISYDDKIQLKYVRAFKEY